jgi:hypothetical protein
MTLTVSLLLLLVVGALVYALASNPKLAEMGRLMYACALLAICFAHPWIEAAIRR